MVTTMTQTYKEKDFDSFVLYSNGLHKETSVFYEYYGLVSNCSSLSSAEIIETVKNHKKTSKANLRIVEEDGGISFYKPNKYIFPVFYITFKNKL